MALRGPKPKYFVGPLYTCSTKPMDPEIDCVIVILFYARDSKLASYRRMFNSRRGSIFYKLCISILAKFEISCFFSLLSAGPLKAQGPRPWPSWPMR